MNILPDKKEHDRLGAGHVNTLNRAARMVLAKNIGNFGFRGPEGSFSGLPPFVQQQCEIVAKGYNTADDSGSSSTAPSNADLYTIRFYYWDADTISWKVDDRGEGFLLDDKLQKAKYEVGDKLTAYWDSQRNAFCPIKGGKDGKINLIHGIVHSCIGYGYYEIEIAEWSGRTPEEVSGSSPSNNCSICEEISDETSGSASVADCSEDQVLPEFEASQGEGTSERVKRQSTGTGVIVLAFDSASRFIPLVLHSDCLMADLGDENPTVGTGDDSLSSGNTEPVYQIVRGHQEHIIQYKERWDCCDGQEKLIGRTAVILIGVECEEEICNDCAE